MGQTDEGTAVVTGQFAVGLSAIFGLTLIAGQLAPTYIRWLSGGTLEIVGTAGTQMGSAFTGIILNTISAGTGFQVRSGDPALGLNCASTIYFIATGATAVFSYIQHRSPDYY
jgi:hypothetical protein